MRVSLPDGHLAFVLGFPFLRKPMATYITTTRPTRVPTPAQTGRFVTLSLKSRTNISTGHNCAAINYIAP